MIDDATLYAINQLSGVMLTIALGAVFLLMLVLWPRTNLHRAALAFMGSIWLVMLRWCVASFRPDIFGAKGSLLAAIFFWGATGVTVWFAVLSWVEYVRDGRREG